MPKLMDDDPNLLLRVIIHNERPYDEYEGVWNKHFRQPRFGIRTARNLDLSILHGRMDTDRKKRAPPCTPQLPSNCTSKKSLPTRQGRLDYPA